MKRTYDSNYSPDEIKWVFTILSYCTDRNDRVFEDRSGHIVRTKTQNTKDGKLLISVTRRRPNQTRGIFAMRCCADITPHGSGSKIEATLKGPGLSYLLSYGITLIFSIGFAILGGWFWIWSAVLLFIGIYGIVSYHKSFTKEMDYVFTDLIYQVNLGSKKEDRAPGPGEKE